MAAERGAPYQEWLRIEWKHDHPDEPVTLYVELDANRWETRKVDVYVDGRMDFADSERRTGTTWLAEKLCPSVEEIESDPVFQVAVVPREEFERVFGKASLRHAQET